MKTRYRIQGKKVWGYVQAVFLLLTTFFIVRFLYLNYPTLSRLQLSPRPLDLIFALILSSLSVLLFALKNSLVYELETKKINFWELVGSVIRANLYRYIPGGIWNHLGLIADLSRTEAISIKNSSKLQFLSVLTNVYAGLFFLVFVLPGFWKLAYLILYAIIFLAFIPFLNLFAKVLNGLVKKEIAFPKVILSANLAILAVNLGYWILVGLAFVYFLRGLGFFLNLDLLKNFYLGTAYILAWLAGFLFVPAPNGLGVREYVMAYLLNKVQLSLSVGVSVSLLNRVFILGRDILLFVLFTALKMRTAKRSEVAN